MNSKKQIFGLILQVILGRRLLGTVSFTIAMRVNNFILDRDDPLMTL